MIVLDSNSLIYDEQNILILLNFPLFLTLEIGREIPQWVWKPLAQKGPPCLQKLYLLLYITSTEHSHHTLPPANEVCEGYVFCTCLSVILFTGGSQAHTQGGGWGVWLGGSPGPHRGGGGSRPTPGFVPRLLLRAVRILLECFFVHE